MHHPAAAPSPTRQLPPQPAAPAVIRRGCDLSGRVRAVLDTDNDGVISLEEFVGGYDAYLSILSGGPVITPRPSSKWEPKVLAEKVCRRGRQRHSAAALCIALAVRRINHTGRRRRGGNAHACRSSWPRWTPSRPRSGRWPQGSGALSLFCCRSS